MINAILKKEYLEKVIYYLILILPFTLVTGPFLSDLSVVIITICFIYLSIKEKLYFYYNNLFSKFFLIFFLILLFTSLFSLDLLISLKKTIVYFRFWILSLAVWYMFNTKKKLINNLIISFTLIFIILIIDGYIQFFFKENIFGWPMQGSRLSSLFGDELILGSYLSRLMPIYFGLLIFSGFDKKKYKYILFFVIFIGVETLTFLSGERVAFFFINASSLMLIITMKNYKLFRFFSIITSIILIFFLVNLYPQSTDRIINKTITQLGFENNLEKDKQKNNQNTNTTQKKYIFSIEHQNHYISSLRMFNDHKITGIGPRMFRYTCVIDKYNIWEGCSTHPHNTYVQLIAETGIIGFVFGVTIFLILFYTISKHIINKYIYKKIMYSDFQLCLLSAIVISMWPIIPTGDFFNNWLSIIYFFPVGFYLKTIYSK